MCMRSLSSLEGGEGPLIDGAMANRILRSGTDAAADPATGARGRVDPGSGEFTLAFEDGECTVDGTVVDTCVALLSLPGQAQGLIHGCMGHLHRQVVAQHAGFAGIDTGKVVTHDAG